MLSDYQLYTGDCLETLSTLEENSVQCCVTSPPYYGLRDYGHAGQIGLEKTPELYVSKLVAVFREVRRVLKDDGTLWLNLGDSYANNKGEVGKTDDKMGWKHNGNTLSKGYQGRGGSVKGLKNKDLIGIPWMVAFALRGDGWYLRSEIIWAKPNPMPESVRDRPTKSHEQIFLLSKSPRYYYDATAIKEPSVDKESHTGRRVRNAQTITAFDLKNHKFAGSINEDGTYKSGQTYETRNKRTVWTVTTKPYKGAHFAVFPPDLIEPCILAGSKVGDTVLDPFNGSGTTGKVSLKNKRKYIGLELNPEYVELSKNRIENQ